MGSSLRGLLKNQEVDVRDLLRKFWVDCHRLRTMPENVVRKMLFIRPTL